MKNIFLIFISLSWLIPNHYPPWVSAWNEGWAIASVFSLLFYIKFTSRQVTPVSWGLTSIFCLCLATIWTQNFSGKILFTGDAVVASMYIGVWFLSVLTGSSLASPNNSYSNAMHVMNASWSGAAVISVGIALVQWTGALSLGIYAADLPPNVRPFANVAQPNHFSTLCFLGLCGLLWLQQQQLVRGTAFWIAATFLLWGMVMSQSRTGWVQIAVLVTWGVVMRDRASLYLTRLRLMLLGTIFATGVMLWPILSEALLLSKARGLEEQLSAGVRFPYWRAMLDALSHEPWLGYGWEQVGTAQHRVALDHVPMGVYFEYSHNFVLDLLLWNGIVIGGLVVVILAWWFFSHIFFCRNASVAWLLAALGGIFLHGLLEYPLNYAYFLIPAGIIMGTIESMLPIIKARIIFPRWSVLLGALAFGAIFFFIAADYIKVEENYRIQRIENARIGVEGVTTPVPEIYLLTQMEALLQVGHIQIKKNMEAEKIQWLQKISLRFSYPVVLLRYAEALALSNKPEEASYQIRLLRQLWNPGIFENINSQLAVSQYPEIRKLVLTHEKPKESH